MPGVICVFARQPELGKVKTRLSPLLDEVACLNVHQALVKFTLRELQELPDSSIHLYVSGSPGHAFWNQFEHSNKIELLKQAEGDLGQRLQAAVEQSLARFDWVVLLGSDCPEISAAYLQQAMAALDDGVEAVIGPAADGGYVLLGLRKLQPQLFDGILWGSDQVLIQTEAALRQQNVNFQKLPVLRDLDRPEDLLFFRDRIQQLLSAAGQSLDLPQSV